MAECVNPLRSLPFNTQEGYRNNEHFLVDFEGNLVASKQEEIVLSLDF